MIHNISRGEIVDRCSLCEEKVGSEQDEKNYVTITYGSREANYHLDSHTNTRDLAIHLKVCTECQERIVSTQQGEKFRYGPAMRKSDK